ncbi:D-alanyl-D-alanine carboxypeptidase/D-alanyl-D-alanine-endopeptidase [Trueperella pyogenes]|uniref:D-alanyl-D-alanine carboxypeptidase/D-alanyl-D-alanine endopeptidase n=1 Tax=Trueperella pyogenes TaxID=1661 RepID=UPI00324994E9
MGRRAHLPTSWPNVWEDDDVWKRIVALLLAITVGGYLFADAWDLVPGPLTTKPALPEPLPYPTLSQVTAHAPEPDEQASPTAANPPSPTGVAALISALANAENNTGKASVIVADPLTGKTIASYNPDRPTIPASNMKIVTARAALDVLGPENTLPTVVAAQGSTLYLVGGGDVLLAEGAGDPRATRGRAGLADLAGAVVDKLSGSVTQVNLVVDSSLFEGPQYFTDIEGVDRGYVMELRPLAVDRGRVQGRGYLPNPDLLAGEAFAEHLRAAGLGVGEVKRGTVTNDAVELARVESAPVRELVDLLLTESDNSLSEVMGHLVAKAKGKPATFAGSAAAIGEVMAAAGYPMKGVTLGDASGLSRLNRVTAELLTAILLDTWKCQECRFAALPAGLPVSALNGTLTQRFGGTAVAGQVRAKTGTLVEAISLSGYLRTEAGYPLVFSIMLDELEPGTAPSSRTLIDTLVTGLAKL